MKTVKVPWWAKTIVRQAFEAWLESANLPVHVRTKINKAQVPEGMTLADFAEKEIKDEFKRQFDKVVQS